MSWTDPNPTAVQAVYQTFRRCTPLNALVPYASDKSRSQHARRKLVSLYAAKDGDTGAKGLGKGGVKRGAKGGNTEGTNGARGQGRTVKFTVVMAPDSISNSTMAFCRISSMLEMQVRCFAASTAMVLKCSTAHRQSR
jgi:hypothetical protein